MTDIVERLQQPCGVEHVGSSNEAIAYRLRLEAADEILSLRAKLAAAEEEATTWATIADRLATSEAKLREMKHPLETHANHLVGAQIPGTDALIEFLFRLAALVGDGQ